MSYIEKKFKTRIEAEEYQKFIRKKYGYNPSIFYVRFYSQEKYVIVKPKNLKPVGVQK